MLKTQTLFFKKISIIFISRMRIRKTVCMKNQCFNFVIYLWWISLITGNGFVGNIFNIFKILRKQFFLFVNADICKTIVSRKLAYHLSNLVNISLLIIPNFAFISKRIVDFNIEFCKCYVVMTV